jgi:hypothetical protein
MINRRGLESATRRICRSSRFALERATDRRQIMGLRSRNPDRRANLGPFHQSRANNRRTKYFTGFLRPNLFARGSGRAPNDAGGTLIPALLVGNDQWVFVQSIEPGGGDYGFLWCVANAFYPDLGLGRRNLG